VLIDTDVYSYLMTGKNYAALYKQHVDGKLIAISFVTVGELYYGAYRRGWKAERIAELKDRLRSVTIVPYDEQLCITYARIRAETERKGNPVAPNDLWIAASAIRHSIPLVSNNSKHFDTIPGLILISESQAMKEMQSQLSLATEPPPPAEPTKS
jgi:tRNA(fMet)-specific endonuclease VapC